MTHYFNTTQNSKEIETSFTCTVLGRPYTFYCASGMFSIGHLDKGTTLLIETASQHGLHAHHHVLDLGCGYGPVGMVIAKQFGVPVTFVDTNTRALRYARKNCKLNDIQDCTFSNSDGYTKLADRMFHLVLFNPPQHAGKKLCNQLIAQTKNHLHPGGALHVVARHNKGGSSFAAFMEETYGSVETLVKKSGFRVYRSVMR